MASEKTILVPIDRYRVDYEIGYGTPFSSFDLIVLGTIAEDESRGVADLARILCLPPRLLVESIVSLTRIGWVAVGRSDREFEVTQAGLMAIESGDPPRPEQIEAREDSVVMERVSGQLATLRDVTYWTAKRLRDTLVEGRSIWESAERLERNPHLPLLDAGRVKPLLRRASEHSGWIRWIASPIPQLEAWLKVDIGPDGSINGVPDAWRLALQTKLSETLDLSVSEVQSSYGSCSVRNKSELIRPGWEASPEQLALIKGGAEHWDVLRLAFDKAQSQLLIASAFLSAEVIEKDLRPLVVAAIERGVRVDLMWGYSKGGVEDEKTIRALKSIRTVCRDGNFLRFNESPSGSHAKLLLWDDLDTGFRAVVGSNNWLSIAQKDYEEGHFEVSVDLQHSGILSDLCTTIAGLWPRSEGPLAGAPDIWHRTAGELERQTLAGNVGGSVGGRGISADLQSSGQSVLSVVRDQEHETIIRELLLGGRQRVGIASHRIGPKSPIRLASLQYRPEDIGDARELKVLVGLSPEDDSSLRETVEVVKSLGGSLSVRRGVHAKLLVVDDSVLVSSYNPLSADPFNTAENAREVGILIRNKIIADAAWAWIDELAKVNDA